MFFNVLGEAIRLTRSGENKDHLMSLSMQVDMFYNWKWQKKRWEELLTLILTEPLELPDEREMLVINTTR